MRLRLLVMASVGFGIGHAIKNNTAEIDQILSLKEIIFTDDELAEADLIKFKN